ncbi:phage gp6-like head-tail connector protein [Streptomyces sp. URMC 125]|uniref:phage gp6-like head-tail connector protein n=1 Tax=Streptomyces sp. URMC 125 TaxID=3423419 RepID=UPI003F1CDEF0
MAARLGRPIPEEERLRVEAFLADASAFVEDYCGLDFAWHQDETFSLTPTINRQLLIPARYLPSLTITSVSFDGGDPLDDWTRRGHSLWRDTGWDDSSAVLVTGTWGFEEVPATVKAVVCAEVVRWLAVNPGVTSERVGDLEVQFTGASTVMSLSRTATSALARYRRRFGSLTLRRSDM